jgi:hypothetical protein
MIRIRGMIEAGLNEGDMSKNEVLPEDDLDVHAIGDLDPHQLS